MGFNAASERKPIAEDDHCDNTVVRMLRHADEQRRAHEEWMALPEKYRHACAWWMVYGNQL